jgi:hypothetical protein
MFIRALRDGNVWLAIGMVCLALFFALEHWAGTSPTVGFVRGFLIGLALVAFGVATAMLIAQHNQAPQKPASRSASAKKGRR